MSETGLTRRPSRSRLRPCAAAFVAAVVCVVVGLAASAVPAHAEVWGWQHALRVVRDLSTDPPRAPLVLLLGGSCARESTLSDESWAADVRGLSGFPVVAHNLGSSTQTFEQDVALVGALPKAPTIVFIALNRGRFTSDQTVTTSVKPATNAKGDFSQHHYSSALVETRHLKRWRMQMWVRKKYPQFRQRVTTNMSVLGELIAACQRRGYRPVLLEMPRDTAVIGHAFDAAVGQYQAGARDLAQTYHVPYVDFVAAAGFVDGDFYDLDHLVEPGRMKFQSQLAVETSRLLALYKMGPPATPAATPAPSTLTSGAGSLVLWPAGMAAIVLGGALVQRRRSARWFRQAP